MNIKETENDEKNASDMTSRCLRKNKTINSIKLAAKRCCCSTDGAQLIKNS